MKRIHLMISVIILAAFLTVSCGEGDGLSIEDGKLQGQATVPLLPFDLPIFPTDVTLEGLEDWVEDELDDELGFLNVFDEDDIKKFFEKVEKKLREASLEILQPGVLSVEVDNIVTEVFQSVVNITRVGINFEFENKTDEWVDVPVEFQLFLGDGEKAEAWDESVLVPFADPRVDEDGKFIVEPGETISWEIENVQHLVDALNESKSFGIGYRGLYKMADVNNGADLGEVANEFALCLVEGLILGSTSQCPSVSELLNWHLALKKFEIVVEAESEIEIPDIPGCSEFADALGLDSLKEACGG